MTNEAKGSPSTTIRAREQDHGSGSRCKPRRRFLQSESFGGREQLPIRIGNSL
jgi:hypothetical protein